MGVNGMVGQLIAFVVLHIDVQTSLVGRVSLIFHCLYAPAITSLTYLTHGM